jgi:dTDP-4-amino-4,6-dideoxygalactose transaminase
MKIPFFFSQREHKHLKKKIISSISKSLIHGKTLRGPEVSNLELKLSKYIGFKYAIAVGSCTDASFFSLKAINIKEGDEVIVTSYSYLASATCILRCGAVPVSVDVNENGNMDLNQIEKKFTSKTKAIIYVHLFGYQENINKLPKFIKKKNIYLIEDFAQAFGAKYKNSYAGSYGDISCTSFDPTKVLSAPGSGGMAFTNNKFLRDRIVELRYHGKNKKGENDSLGINSQLPTLMASSLLVKF